MITMPEKMPEKSKEFIETECPKVARREQGCSDLKHVLIGRTKPGGSRQKSVGLRVLPYL
jgi:hypothetical protein